MCAKGLNMDTPAVHTQSFTQMQANLVHEL